MSLESVERAQNRELDKAWEILCASFWFAQTICNDGEIILGKDVYRYAIRRWEIAVHRHDPAITMQWRNYDVPKAAPDQLIECHLSDGMIFKELV